MIDFIIKLILVLLVVFTPVAFGSIDVWAFSLMELGIFLIMILWSAQNLSLGFHPAIRDPRPAASPDSELKAGNSKLSRSAIRHPQFVIILLFLLLVLFQMLPLPPAILKLISPRTYDLRSILSPFSFQLSALSSELSFPISLVSFGTQIEFFKWLAYFGLFFLLLRWGAFRDDRSITRHLLLAILLVGFAESLYGMLEFFSGHKHILNLEGESLVSSVTGTFINRNYFAGYLLMVIPLSLGYLFSREGFQRTRFTGWRNRLSSLDGKSALIAFGVVVMVLALLFSASRMGIMSLLLSFSLISFLFRNPGRERSSSKTAVLIFSLAVLWAAWIGLDAVISRFFTVSEGFQERWRIWADTFRIFKDFPLLGSGLGTFTQIFPSYRSFYIRGVVTHAENDFLQLLSEVGLVGMGLLAILFLYLFLKAVSEIRSLSRRDPQRYIAIGGMVGILALMFHSLVERNIQVPSNAFLYTVLWGIVLTRRSKDA